MLLHRDGWQRLRAPLATQGHTQSRPEASRGQGRGRARPVLSIGRLSGGTSVTDSVAGAITARYNADGNLTTQGLPGGYTMKQEQDPTGAATSRVYTRDSDGTVLVSDRVAQTS
ncbi:hypothetical protein [Streptomyces sp. NBC_00829]|uniref:hypothetical protein n=1 Tax=Streptomyces sp. NBC_00829 TaxID=2903679 RepID=UPI00386FCB80|nr:hypothetical protein OG293_36565 [Streptomyces sp. NBC_00829]